MKKQILLFSLLLAAVGAEAQSSSTITPTTPSYIHVDHFDVIPRDLRKSGHAYFSVEDKASHSYDIYDFGDDGLTISKVKTVAIPSWTSTPQVNKHSVYSASTWNDAKTWMINDRGILSSDIDNTLYKGSTPNPNQYYEWDAASGDIYEVHVDYIEVGRPLEYSYNDYEDNSHTDDGAVFTQTLFNDDELFEYIVVDGSNLKIVQEGGTVLHTISISSSYPEVDIMRFKDFLYLVVRGSSSNTDFYFYRIREISSTRGDVNGDGVVNAADVVTIVKMIMESK